MKALGKLFSGDRAARSIARLYSGEMSAEQEREIRNWSGESMAYRQEFQQANWLLDDLQGLADDPDIRAVLAGSGPKGLKEHTLDNWPRLATAAVLLLALVLGIAFLAPVDVSVEGEYTPTRYVTRVGEQRSVSLDDGSTITLNTGTQLLVDIRGDSRRITLERGEAFFDVVKDPLRPFSVDLGQRTVTVLGTSFNILKSPEKLTVTVMTGEVSIHKPDLQVISTAPVLMSEQDEVMTVVAPEQNRLTAGWVAEFDTIRNQILAYRAKNIERQQGWRNGQIRFENETLREVVQELNRYTGKKILIEDTAIMDIKVFAAVRLDRIDLALTSFEKTLPVKVVRHFDRTVLKER